MSIKDKYKVISIDKKLTYEWLLYKHYAKAIPNIIYSFGIYNKKILEGICCYGTPANNHNNSLGDFKMLELVRLCVNENLEKNVLSFFVSQTFKHLPQQLSLISYADKGKNHSGYIYQATNWIYTGLGGGVDYYKTKDGKEIHSRIMSDYRIKMPQLTRDQIARKLEWEKIKGTYKHRYFYFVGSKKEKKQWLSVVKSKYGIFNYPKEKNIRYDSNYKTSNQEDLFI